MHGIRQQMLFVVYANDIKKIQADCFHVIKKLFINYAVDITNRRNLLMAVDVSKTSVDSFAESFFDFLDQGNHGHCVTLAERNKVATRLRLLFDLFKITLNAQDVEMMIFKSVKKNLKSFWLTKCENVNQFA